MPDRVKVYRKSTGEKLQHPMRREDLRWNPDLAVVPSHRDRDAAARRDLEAMTVPALRALADAEGVDLAGLSLKGDIVAALQTSPDQGGQTQPTTEDPQQGSDNEKE